jgi:hypothetical protein
VAFFALERSTYSAVGIFLKTLVAKSPDNCM